MKDIDKIKIADLDDLDELDGAEDFEDLDDLDDLTMPSPKTVAKSKPVYEEEKGESGIDTDVASDRFFVKSAAYGFSAHEVNRKVCDDSIMDVVVREAMGHDDIERIYQLYIYDYTTQAVIVNYMMDDTIEIQLPKLASIADIELCYAYLYALKELQPDCSICTANGKVVEISEEASAARYKDHCAYMAKQLRQGDVEIQGMNAAFRPNECAAVAEAATEDEKVEAAWNEFQRSQWDEE